MESAFSELRKPLVAALIGCLSGAGIHVLMAGTQGAEFGLAAGLLAASLCGLLGKALAGAIGRT
jgi:hypothetical protein